MVGSWLFGGAAARAIVTVSLQVTAVADRAVCHSSVGWVRSKQFVIVWQLKFGSRPLG